MAKDEVFRKRVLGDGSLATFWNEVSRYPAMAKVKAQIIPDRTIPIAVHGDGAPTNKVHSLFTNSWSSLFAKGTTEETHFLFTVVPKQDMIQATLDKLFLYWAWAINALQIGRMPSNDWDSIRGTTAKGH